MFVLDGFIVEGPSPFVLAANAGVVGILPLIVVAGIVIFVLAMALPCVIGVVFVFSDANRRGQPGWLWVLLTLFCGWFALALYIAIRMLYDAQRMKEQTRG